MKKILFALLLLGTSLFADMKQVMATPEFLEKNPDIKIIDIRTPPEWRETGIVKGSYTIVSFTQKGFNQKFLEELDKVVKKDETFALICRTGSRTAEVSKWLAYDKGYNVINLKGGLMHMKKMGYKPVKYLK
jgi:rhodanese-related sulfurtransferase